MGSEAGFEGKQVFFVQPHSIVQKEMMGELIRQGFAVSQIAQVADAVPIFEKHPDCIAFLNIDEGRTEDGWKSFVRGVQSHPDLKQVRLGVLTYNRDPGLANTYLMDLQITGGFVLLSLLLKDSIETVVKVLEANEARGRRRYLRVECAGETRFNLQGPSGLLHGRVLDISSVGMSCVFDIEQDWPRNTALRSLQLKLKGSLCLVDAVVVGSRPDATGIGRVYIVLFDPKMAPAQREKIHGFIQWTLQLELDKITAHLVRKTPQPA